MSYFYPDTYPDVVFVVDCDHHIIEEHIHGHNCVDSRRAHLQLHHHPEPVWCLRLVTALNDLIGSRHCYGTTITIKCSEGPVGIQKALLREAAHHTVLDLTALVGVTCHVLGQDNSRVLAGVNPVTVICYDGLPNLKNKRWRQDLEDVNEFWSTC